MALYFVSYDLRKTRDYDAISEALTKLGALRVLASQWCLRHGNTTCEALRDHLRQSMDADDGIMVSRVDDWASWNVQHNPNDLG